jgi:hypothetical protein
MSQDVSATRARAYIFTIVFSLHLPPAIADGGPLISGLPIVIILQLLTVTIVPFISNQSFKIFGFAVLSFLLSWVFFALLMKGIGDTISEQFAVILFYSIVLFAPITSIFFYRFKLK